MRYCSITKLAPLLDEDEAEYVCLSVCLPVCPRGYLRNHMRDLYQIFAHVAFVRDSVLLQHAYTIGRIVYRREGVFFPIENALSAGKGDGSAERGRSMLCTIDVDVLWPNGWTDQDATWYGGRPRPRRHCVRWGPSYPTKTGTAPSLTFQPTLLWHGRSS